jgi:hypothetical protein
MDKYSDTIFVPDDVIILDTRENDNKDADEFGKLGVSVLGRTKWDGIVPEGSFIVINPYMRMSTPEFYFFRKCQELSHEDAMELACTLMSHYNTSMTTPKLGDGEVERTDEAHTTYNEMLEYLLRINPCVESDAALSALHDAMPYLDGYEAACEKFCK